MPLTPAWPSAPGPRVLMLVANDITIDARVRKSASSVARAGFSVIVIGLDSNAAAPEIEMLDGALLTRVVPESDPRISPHTIRFSRPELAATTRFRAETRKLQLQVARRRLSADVAYSAANPPAWTQKLGGTISSIGRVIGISEEFSGKAGRRTTRFTRRFRKALRFGPRKITTIYNQIAHQILLYASRWLARPSRPFLRRPTWRRDIPELHRFEASLGAVIDSLEPDLIHAHDVFLLGVAARAKARAQRARRRVQLVYDAHEYVPGLPIDERRKEAYSTLEDEYYKRTDAVVTVSPGLAELLESRYSVKPSVVLNAPDTERNLDVAPLRKVLEIDDATPLVVYVGGIAPHRGAEALIEAISSLPDDNIHLAFVSNSTTGYVASLLTLGAERGLSGRLHLAPYVAPEAVVSYLRTATVTAVPLSRDVLNYEIALPNKLFQSIHAGVPVVVSDNPEMSCFVTEHGVGEVFVGGDADSLATALQKVIDSRESYLTALHDAKLLSSISWATQVDTLLRTYASLGISR